MKTKLCVFVWYKSDSSIILWNLFSHDIAKCLFGFK